MTLAKGTRPFARQSLADWRDVTGAGHMPFTGGLQSSNRGSFPASSLNASSSVRSYRKGVTTILPARIAL